MPQRITVLFLALALAAAPAAASAADSGWKEISGENGVTLYQRNHEGRFVDDFMGVTEVAAPVENVGAALLDVAAYPRWFDRCTKMELVRENAAYDLVLYLVMSSPWPARDRDAVIRATCDVDLEAGKSVILIEKTDDALVPPGGGRIRIPHTRQVWRLETVAPGRTRVTFVNDTDPGGQVAGFLVNWVSKTVTQNSLAALRELLRDPKYVELGKQLAADLIAGARAEAAGKAAGDGEAAGKPAAPPAPVRKAELERGAGVHGNP